MGQLRDPRFVPLLIEILSGDDLWLAADATRALGEIGDSSAIPALVQAMKSQEMWDQFDRAVAQAEAQNQHPNWVLAAVQEADDISDLQAESTAALGRIGDPAAIDGLMEAVNLTRQYQCDVRVDALKALGNIKSERVIPEIARLLEGKYHHLKGSDPDKYWCEIIVEVLEKHGTPEALRAAAAWEESQVANE